MKTYYCCAEEVSDGSIACRHCEGKLALPAYYRGLEIKTDKNGDIKKLIYPIIPVIVGIIIGGFLSFIMTNHFSAEARKERYQQIAKEKKEREDQIARVIYQDTTDNIYQLYKHIYEMPIDIATTESLKKVSIFNTSIHESYLTHIGLLSQNEIIVTLRFYKCLTNVNTRLHNIWDKDFISEDKEVLKEYLYESFYRAILNGHHICKQFEKKHGFQMMGGMKFTIDQLRRKILLRNPELKKKITLKP